MPELPEVRALANAISDGYLNCQVEQIEIASLSVFKTPIAQDSFHSAKVIGVKARGKYLVVEFEKLGNVFKMVCHFSKGGWVKESARNSDKSVPSKPLKLGKGPLLARLTFSDERQLSFTEAGTTHRAAIWVVDDLSQIAQINTLGVDADRIAVEEFVDVLGLAGRAPIKHVLCDQTCVAGIGNGFSDEILYTARLSPFALANKVVGLDQLFTALRVVVEQASARLAGAKIGEIKKIKKDIYMVHTRDGTVCKICQSNIRSVHFADKSLQYCPGCQTRGKLLADRRLSKLLK